MQWKTVKLGDILNFRRGHDLPHAEMRCGDIPVAGSNGCIGYHNEATPIAPIITIGRSGNIGTPYYYDKAWAHNTTLYIDDFKGNNPKYLYYLLKTLPLASFKGGSAVPTLNRNHIHPLEVLHIDDIQAQNKIVAILSSLDDKIENNNRINANLEAQAQALFKSWFVEFEPFGGVMPKDWKEGVLGDIAEFKRGKGILGKDARPGKIPVVAGGIEPAYYHDTANTKAPVITISASGANAGFVRLYNEDVWASDCSWIDASSKNLLWVYCYLSMNRHILRHAQTGAVQPHVKAKDVNAFEIIVPAQEIIVDFINIVKPLFIQIANNQEENKRLAALRDTLLPKLMKGEIEL